MMGMTPAPINLSTLLMFYGTAPICMNVLKHIHGQSNVSVKIIM